MDNKFVFGDPSFFSIQGMHQSRISTSNNEFGNVCITCGGEILGDSNIVVILATVAGQLKQKLKEHNEFLSEKLFLFERHALLDYIEQSLSQSQTYADAAPYESLFLAPGASEAFDGETIVWLNYKDLDRLVWRKFGTQEVKELHVPFGTVACVVQNFINFANSLYNLDI